MLFDVTRKGLRSVLLGALSGVVACSGSISGSTDNPVAERDPTAPPVVVTPPSGGPERPADANDAEVCQTLGIDPGPTSLRRLNHFEYDNSVADLLGDTTHPGRDFPAIERGLGFDNNAIALSVSPVLAEKYFDSAEKLAKTAVSANLARLFNCDTAREGEPACGTKFVEQVGLRAFRRPLDAAEKMRFGKVFSDVRGRSGYMQALTSTLSAFLLSPRFLYRVEFGLPADANAQVLALDDWEMASRLSYFLWNSMPDAALFDRAAAGALRSREGIAAETRRMLADGKAHQMVSHFHEQWMELAKVTSTEKDAILFKDWNPDIAGRMRREIESFLDAQMWQTGGTLTTLLTAPETYLDATLAKFYGIANVSGTAFAKVTPPGNQRAGLLTMGGLLASHAKPNQTSPIHRGKWIRESFLCDVLPPPPPGVEIKAPELDPNLTTRERFAQHQADKACVGCHKLMDDIGLGFESYDAVGRYRDREGAMPIDSSGVMVNGDLDADGNEVDVEFNGVVDLGLKLSQSEKAKACLTRQWFRSAFGRIEEDATNVRTGDACSLAFLRNRFESSGGRILDLVSAITESDAFLYRRPQVQGE